MYVFIYYLYMYIHKCIHLCSCYIDFLITSALFPHKFRKLIFDIVIFIKCFNSISQDAK